MLRKLVQIMVAVLAFSVLSACQKGPEGLDDPKKQLTNYISKSFSIKSLDDRKELLEFLAGDTRERLSTWSDEQFRQAFIETKREFIKLAIVDMKKQNEAEASITYELTYLDQERGKDAKVTTQRLAIMRRDSDRWLIQEVRNMKELVEFRNEMALP